MRADSTWRRVQARVVYDLVYNPPQTTLLHGARAAGAETIGGLEMLVAPGGLSVRVVDGAARAAGVIEAARASVDPGSAAQRHETDDV